MLLMSVCSFAQDNNTPLVGDVNEDGKVDIADIVAILNIMKEAGGTAGDSKYYFYVGTTKPTSLSQASVVESYPAEQTFTNPSTTEKNYVHVLTNLDKTVNFYDPSDLATPATKTEDITTIPGYKITSMTVRIAKGGTQVIKISDEAPTTYYWYVGQIQPSTMTSISPIVTDNSSPGWREIGTTLPTYSSSNKLWSANDIITTGSSLAKQYIAIPANSSACPRDGFGADASTVDIYTKLSNVTISGVEYKVYETVGRMKRHNLDIY